MFLWVISTSPTTIIPAIQMKQHWIIWIIDSNSHNIDPITSGNMGLLVGTFSPPPRVSDPDMHHGTRVVHVSWGMLGSLTSGFLWSRWRGKRSWHSRCIRNPQFCVSGKRPMTTTNKWRIHRWHILSDILRCTLKSTVMLWFKAWQTSPISPSRVGYGVFIANILMELTMR